MLIHPGTQERVISESTAGSGVTSRNISIQSDTALVSVWLSSVTSGSLTIRVYEQLTDTQESLVLEFDPLSTASTEITKLQTEVVNARLRIEATYTGVMSYEVYTRAVGSSSNSGNLSGLLLPAIVTFIELLSMDTGASVIVNSGARFQIVSGNGISTSLASGSEVTIS